MTRQFWLKMLVIDSVVLIATTIIGMLLRPLHLRSLLAQISFFSFYGAVILLWAICDVGMMVSSNKK